MTSKDALKVILQHLQYLDGFHLLYLVAAASARRRAVTEPQPISRFAENCAAYWREIYQQEAIHDDTFPTAA